MKRESNREKEGEAANNGYFIYPGPLWTARVFSQGHSECLPLSLETSIAIARGLLRGGVNSQAHSLHGTGCLAKIGLFLFLMNE